MYDRYSENFDQFYMGKLKPSVYDVFGMKHAEYPFTNNYKVFTVVEVRDGEAITSKVFGANDFITMYPDAKPHIKNNGPFSWKDSDDIWYHVVCEIDEGERNAAKAKYRDFQNDLSKHFENYLRNEIMPDELNNNDALFSVLYSKAWESGHSSGYANVVNEFESECQFAVDIINALSK